MNSVAMAKKDFFHSLFSSKNEEDVKLKGRKCKVTLFSFCSAATQTSSYPSSSSSSSASAKSQSVVVNRRRRPRMRRRNPLLLSRGENRDVSLSDDEGEKVLLNGPHLVPFIGLFGE